MAVGRVCDRGGFSGRRAARDRFRDRKSTRLNSSHSQISYAVFCLKKKKAWVRTAARVLRSSAFARTGYCGVSIRASVGIETYEIQRRINNPEAIVLVKKTVLISPTGLYVVNAFHVRDIRTNPRVGQRAVLT